MDEQKQLITANQLIRMLKPFGDKPVVIRMRMDEFETNFKATLTKNSTKVSECQGRYFDAVGYVTACRIDCESSKELL